MCYMPGEDPAAYQGEKGYALMGPRKDINKRTIPAEFTVEDHKHIGNRIISNATIDLDPDMGTASVKGTATYTGGCKELAGKLTNTNEWIANVEEHLGISKKYVDKEYDAVERENEVRGIVPKNVHLSWALSPIRCYPTRYRIAASCPVPKVSSWRPSAIFRTSSRP